MWCWCTINLFLITVSSYLQSSVMSVNHKSLCNNYHRLIVLVETGASVSSARSLFRRYADRRLSSVWSDNLTNTTVDSCAVACVSETEFQCRSFTYDNRHRSCLLYTVNTAERDVRLLAATDVDTYDCQSSLVSHSLSHSH